MTAVFHRWRREGTTVDDWLGLARARARLEVRRWRRARSQRARSRTRSLSDLHVEIPSAASDLDEVRARLAQNADLLAAFMRRLRTETRRNEFGMLFLEGRTPEHVAAELRRRVDNVRRDAAVMLDELRKFARS